MKIKAALLDDYNGKFHVEEIDQAAPRANEIRVKMVSCGICATDMAMRDKVWGCPLQFPVVFGHEGAGVVEEIGPGVTEFEVGDHVVLSVPWCGVCEQCVNGWPWVCERVDELTLGSYLYDGKTVLSKDGKPVYHYFSQSAFATHCVVHVNSANKVPKELPLKIAGPLGCGLRTGAGEVYNNLKPRVNEWVTITGAGPVGFAAMWMANAMGAQTLMVDVRDQRLDKAKELGATAVLNSKGMNVDELADAIKKICDGKGTHYVVETSSVPVCYKAGMKALRNHGKCSQVAIINEMEFNQFSFENQNKAIDVIRMGSVSGKVIIPVLAELYLRGMFPYDKLITYYSLEQVNEACDDSSTGKVFKPVLLFD